MIARKKMNTATKFGVFCSMIILVTNLSLIDITKAQEDYLGYSYIIDAYIYNNHTVNLNNLSVIQSQESYFPSSGTGYQIEEYSSEGLLFEGNLEVSFDEEVTFFPGESNESQKAPLRSQSEKAWIFIRVPGFSNATKLALTYDGTTLIEASLRDYICDKDKICELGESSYICPEDCGPVKERGNETKDRKSLLSQYGLGLMILIFIVILLTAYFMKKRRVK